MKAITPIIKLIVVTFFVYLVTVISRARPHTQRTSKSQIHINYYWSVLIIINFYGHIVIWSFYNILILIIWSVDDVPMIIVNTILVKWMIK